MHPDTHSQAQQDARPGADEPMRILKMRRLAIEIRKLSRENEKLLMETRWYPMVVTAALVAAASGIQRLFS